MFKRLPFPLAYALEPLLAIPLFASFYLVVAFVASKPAEAIRASGAHIPDNWEAALPNHGGYLRGFLPSTHPLLLALSVVALGLFGIVAWQLRVAQTAQQRAAAPEHAGRYKVAAAATFACWAIVAWVLVTQALPHLAAA